MVPLLLSLLFDVDAIARPTGALAVDTTSTRVHLILEATSALPASTTTLTAEVVRVWHAAGVSVHWASAAPFVTPDADRVIRVVASDAMALPRTALGGVPVVAGRPRQIIYVSPSRVRQLVIASGAQPGTWHFDSVYARMLGRVVAHELGHLLLPTRDHRSQGLMRATFETQDVLSAEAARFDLSPTDVAAIHDRTIESRLTASFSPRRGQSMPFHSQ